MTADVKPDEGAESDVSLVDAVRQQAPAYHLLFSLS